MRTSEFTFALNVPKIVPQTGKVYGIDRMTSDYAQAHPFDVEGFIDAVCKEYAGKEGEESPESLHALWHKVLRMREQGDGSLYPLRHGARRFSAFKVWDKATEYWRRGLRDGDVLPDIVPSFNIMRLEDGWVSLSPKEREGIFPTAEPLQEVAESSHEVADLPHKVDDLPHKVAESSHEVAEPSHEVVMRPVLYHALGIAGCGLAMGILWETGLLMPLAIVSLIVGAIR